MEEKRLKSLIETPIPVDLSRRDAVSSFRLTTDHDYLQSDRPKIAGVEGPMGILFNQGKIGRGRLDTRPALTDSIEIRRLQMRI